VVDALTPMGIDDSMTHFEGPVYMKGKGEEFK